MKIKTLFSTAVLHTAFLFPTSYTWNTAATPSNWSVPANWTPAGPPTLAGDIAIFSTIITGPTTVNVDMPSFIVGTLSFTNTANPYTIAALMTNSLALQGSAGTAAITNAAGVTSSNVISTPLVLTNPLTITQNSTTNPLTISGVMSGASAVTTVGAGTIVFTGANSYTGGTTVTAGELDCNSTGTLPAAGALTISGGTVKCGAINALPSTGTITLSGGTLNLNNLSQSTGPITGTSNITLGSGTLTSTTTTATTYSGVISGTGGFALAGSGGMLTFATNQTYSGGTTVTGSTLLMNPGITLFSGGNLTVTGPGIFNLNNNTQTVGLLSGTGSGSILLGSGALTTNGTTPATFAGVISGTGSFTQAGTSVQTFTGVNTYTGGTTINTGATLQLGINNALAPKGTVNILGTGILDLTPAASTAQAIGPLSGAGAVHLGVTQLTINSSTSSSYGGVISGTGSLVAAGPQTLTLTNNNTYNGGTTVSGGTLAIGVTNALLPTGNLAVNSPGIFNLAGFNQTVGVLSGNGSITLGTGTLTVNTPAAMTSTFSGVISQAGALHVGSTGTLILSGANTYSGGTVVAAGATLQGTITSLQGAIANAGSVILNQPFAGTFSGTLSGAGSLLINGGGNITFNTSQTEGTTNVTAGELILTNPAILTSNTTIGPGGSLGGNGQITGTVNNNGDLQLGLNSFTIVGNYNQNAGSFFTVNVTPSSNGLLTESGGTVTLSSSATMDIDIVQGIYPATTLYTLISSTAPVAGTFAPPVVDNPFFGATLLYNQGVLPGSVQLSLSIVPFSNVIKGGNAGAIAKCINLQAFPAETLLLPIINDLIFLPVEKVRDALDEMQPSQLKALGLTQENNFVVIRSTISQHSDDFYKTECNQCIPELYNWNVWSNFTGDFLRQEGQRQNVGYSADTVGTTIGWDIALAKNLFLGAAVAYDHSWLDWNNSRGHAQINSYYLGPYFTWFNHWFFANASILGTFNQYEASRHIMFHNVDTHAKNSHNGYGAMGHFDLGALLYPTAGMTCSPIVGLDYIHLWERGYTEHDAGSLSMKIFPTHASLFRTELGIEVAKCAVLAHSNWTHDLKLSWIHQFPMSGKNLHAQFAEFDCTYTVQGVQPNQDYLDIATGLTGLFMEDRLSAALRYEGKFGDGIRDNTAYAQLTYRF